MIRTSKKKCRGLEDIPGEMRISQIKKLFGHLKEITFIPTEKEIDQNAIDSINKNILYEKSSPNERILL